MQPSTEIIFDSLDFIANQLRNLHLQDLEPPVLEEEEPLAICMFLVRLEDVMEEGSLTLPNHMNLYAQEAFTEFSQEYLLNLALGSTLGSQHGSGTAT
jgi:hypothetical protein